MIRICSSISLLIIKPKLRATLYEHSWFGLLQFASLSHTLVFPDCLASTQDSTTAPIPSAGRRAPVVGTVVSVSCRQQGVDAAQGKVAKGTISMPATTMTGEARVEDTRGS